MENLTKAVQVAVLILAVWKIHDLLFPKRKQVLPAKDRILIGWQEQFLLVKFFAEYFYRISQGLKTYVPAPKEVYDYLLKEFQNWLAQKQK